MVIVCSALASAQAGPPAVDAVWADGQLFRTVFTPTVLPDKGPKDGIFAFPGVAGQRPVAESKPGDTDYNGGRWQVYAINVLDADALDHELTSWEEVQAYIDSGVLEIAGLGPSFVCPLIK
jgi:hypothetical protein